MVGVSAAKREKEGDAWPSKSPAGPGRVGPHGRLGSARSSAAGLLRLPASARASPRCVLAPPPCGFLPPFCLPFRFCLPICPPVSPSCRFRPSLGLSLSVSPLLFRFPGVVPPPVCVLCLSCLPLGGGGSLPPVSLHLPDTPPANSENPAVLEARAPGGVHEQFPRLGRRGENLPLPSACPRGLAWVIPLELSQGRGSQPFRGLSFLKNSTPARRPGQQGPAAGHLPALLLGRGDSDLLQAAVKGAAACLGVARGLAGIRGIGRIFMLFEALAQLEDNSL